jgi:hypothetical protein
LTDHVTALKAAVDPQRARAGALGGFYRQIPFPGTIICTVCGEERNSIGQEDGLCLRCRWAKRTDERRQHQEM